MTSKPPCNKDEVGDDIQGPKDDEIRDESTLPSNQIPITSDVNRNSIEDGTNSNSNPDAAASKETVTSVDEELASERPIERVASSGEEYSVLTVTQKKLVVLTVSLASLFSPMATAIYCIISTKTLFGSSTHTITRPFPHDHSQ
jgi:hypothetical protein